MSTATLLLLQWVGEWLQSKVVWPNTRKCSNFCFLLGGWRSEITVLWLEVVTGIGWGSGGKRDLMDSLTSHEGNTNTLPSLCWSANESFALGSSAVAASWIT